MSLKKTLKSKKCQTVIEYTLFFAIMLSALVASGLITNVKNIFTNHFNDVVGRITGG